MQSNSHKLSNKNFFGSILFDSWTGYPQHLICQYPFIHLGGERHCESKVSCPRTQHIFPGQGWNTELLDPETSALTMKPLRSNLTTAYVVCITAMINHVYISFSTVKIYDLSYIPLYSSPSTVHVRVWVNYELAMWWVQHCTGIAEVTGSSPFQAWIFFQALISWLLKLYV